MNTVTGWFHQVFAISNPYRVSEALGYASHVASMLNWNEKDRNRLARVVSELSTNLQRHARNGRLLIASRNHADDVEVLAVDEGPGVEDVALMLQRGHSPDERLCTGLAAVRRLADEFDIYSAAPTGTVVVARVRSIQQAPAAMGTLKLGAICLPAPYETVCGDGWAIADDEGAVTLFVADGLGHGPEAAKASQAATAEFSSGPRSDLSDIVVRVHRALKTTRGAVVCALRVDGETSTISYTGAGNIAGRIVSGIFDRSVITQPGTAGAQIRKPVISTLEMPAHALVILHSDGIEMRWKAETIRPLLQKDPALIAAVLWRNHTRHRDDVTVVAVRTTSRTDCRPQGKPKR